MQRNRFIENSRHQSTGLQQQWIWMKIPPKSTTGTGTSTIIANHKFVDPNQRTGLEIGNILIGRVPDVFLGEGVSEVPIVENILESGQMIHARVILPSARVQHI